MELAPLAVAVPLLAAGGLTAAGTRLNRNAAQAIALPAALVVCAICVALLVRTADGLEIYWFGGWEPRHGMAIGVSFAIDAFGAGLATLVALLVVTGLVLMWRYRETDPPHFQVLMLLFCAGMVGFCLSGDLFNMFVFFELMSIAAFALAGFKVEESEAIEGSLNFAVTNTIGSFLILTGIGLLYGRTGVLNLAQIGDSLSHGGTDGLVIAAFALLASGFLVKAAVVPFHFWLADAYAVAPTPVCLVFAGAMSELGIYAVGRIWFDAFAPALGGHADELRTVLILAGALTAVVGAVMCFCQDHLRRLLAFATIAYVGVFLIGLGLLSAEGVGGAALYIIADGLGKASLFATVGILQHRRRGLSELRLAGKGRGIPYTGIVVLVGALSFAALPPFGTFFGKALLEDGLLKEGYGWGIAVLLVTSAVTSGAVLRFAARVFLGWGADDPGRRSSADETHSEEEGDPDRTPAVMFLPAAMLAAGSLALGLIPGTVEAIEQGAQRFAAGSDYAQAVLHGTSVSSLPAVDPYTAPLHAYLYAILTLVLAVGLAIAGLFGHRLRGGPARWLARLGDRLLTPLHAVHSGHIGDYVAWLVLGVAVFGGAFAIGFQ